MTPLSTINLLRLLFLVAALAIGAMLGAERLGSSFSGGALGLVFALALVLVDRLLKGFTLRAFSSATFGLLLGLLCATLLRASGVLDYQPAETRWLISLLLYAAFAYLGMMLAIRSNRDDFSLITARRARSTPPKKPPTICAARSPTRAERSRACNAPPTTSPAATARSRACSTTGKPPMTSAR
jgi:hypothetical protein